MPDSLPRGEWGFWLLAQFRMMTLHEIMRLQGISPGMLDLSVVSARQAGRMLGAAFTQSVITRLLAGLLHVRGLTGTLLDPYEGL